MSSSVVKRENSNICLELNFRSLSTLKHNGYAAATARPIFLDYIDRLDSKISQLKDKLLRMTCCSNIDGRMSTFAWVEEDCLLKYLVSERVLSFCFSGLGRWFMNAGSISKVRKDELASWRDIKRREESRSSRCQENLKC